MHLKTSTNILLNQYESLHPEWSSTINSDYLFQSLTNYVIVLYFILYVLSRPCHFVVLDSLIPYIPFQLVYFVCIVFYSQGYFTVIGVLPIGESVFRSSISELWQQNSAR